MKKRIALILAVIATVSTLGSNAVMARYPVCIHANTRDVYTGHTEAKSDEGSTHTWYDTYRVECVDCEEVLDFYERAVAQEAHKKSVVITSTRVDDPDREGYYWYEVTYHCATCGGDFTVVE